MTYRFHQRLLSGSACAVALSLSLTQGAYALSFSPSDDLQIDWDTTLTYGAAWRVENRDSRLTEASEFLLNVDQDDGNRNFDTGLISNRVSGITEIDLNYKRDFGAFVRARAYYDDVYHQSTDNVPAGPFHNSPSVPTNEFARGTRKQHGAKAEFLDYFLYGNFDLGGRNLNLRAGSQVVSWGESLFIVGGISTAQSPVDATQLGVPGVELKDIFLPVEQLYAQLDLTDMLSLEAYTQFEWDKSRLNGAGSYFSYSDFYDAGAELSYALGGMPRGSDVRAKNSGQYGVALRYLAESLNNTDFGLYYVRYHDKLPVFAYPDFTNYYLRYAENIDLYGASFGTVIGDTNISGEVTYRKNAELISTAFTGIKADIVQAQLSGIHIFGPSALADSVVVIGEVGTNSVHRVKASQLFVGDTTGWGFALAANLAYNAIAPGVDMVIPLTWNHDLAGNERGDGPVLATFDKGKDVVSVGAEFIYLNDLKADIKYTAFLGQPDEDAQADRDYVSVSLKYSF